jgi:hypothetical protein
VGVIENMKDVAELVKKFGDIELNRRILTLENEVLDLSREKRRAEEKIEELQQTLKIKKELIFKDNQYYLRQDDQEVGPYCSLCWDRDNTLIRKVEHHLYGLSCPACVQVRIKARNR